MIERKKTTAATAIVTFFVKKKTGMQPDKLKI